MNKALQTGIRFCKQNLKRYLLFGIVGVTGVGVDMFFLFVFADSKMFGLNLSFSKFLSAEIAIMNNFAWNELWTFGDIPGLQKQGRARLRRFAKFNLICVAGIVLSIFFLNIQVHWLGMNAYLANLIAILMVSFWNFGLTLKFGWNSTAMK